MNGVKNPSVRDSALLALWHDTSLWGITRTQPGGGTVIEKSNVMLTMGLGPGRNISFDQDVLSGRTMRLLYGGGPQLHETILSQPNPSDLTLSSDGCTLYEHLVMSGNPDRTL